jgi:hypothetical protein
LVQAAHAVGRSKKNYLSAQFSRIASRRGKKRAAVAVAHSILVIAYHIIKDGTEYIDLGANYFDERKQEIVQGCISGFWRSSNFCPKAIKVVS